MSTIKFDPIRGYDVKHAVIATAAAGATQLVAAVVGKRIRVLGYTLVAAAAVTAKFQSATNDLTGALPLAANGGASPTGAPQVPLFETNVGEALNVNLGGAVAVAGHLTYMEV